MTRDTISYLQRSKVNTKSIKTPQNNNRTSVELKIYVFSYNFNIIHDNDIFLLYLPSILLFQ